MNAVVCSTHCRLFWTVHRSIIELNIHISKTIQNPKRGCKRLYSNCLDFLFISQHFRDRYSWAEREHWSIALILMKDDITSDLHWSILTPESWEPAVRMTGLVTDILRVMVLVVEESQTRPLAATVWRWPSARLETLTRDLPPVNYSSLLLI